MRLWGRKAQVLWQRFLSGCPAFSVDTLWTTRVWRKLEGETCILKEQDKTTSNSLCKWFPSFQNRNLTWSSLMLYFIWGFSCTCWLWFMCMCERLKPLKGRILQSTGIDKRFSARSMSPPWGADVVSPFPFVKVHLSREGRPWQVVDTNVHWAELNIAFQHVHSVFIILSTICEHLWASENLCFYSWNVLNSQIIFCQPWVATWLHCFRLSLCQFYDGKKTTKN